MSLLGSPIRIAGLTIPNRTVMAAMSSALGAEDGKVTPEIIAYYHARAEGGTGLIVVEFTCVDQRLGRAEMRQMALDSDDAIAGHVELVASIKRAGACAGIQLHAPGQHADRRTLEGIPAGPSAVFSRRDGVTPLCRALDTDEIEGLIASFGKSAARAVAAGYEAIELHGAHGYLLMAFMSPLKNLRTDEWGGDEQRRLRFPLAVIRAVKAALGPDRPLIYRLSSSDFMAGGLGLEDMVRIAPQLVAAGVDAIHVSSGTIDGTLDRTVDPMSMEEAWRFSHCRAIKAATHVPVIGVGPVRWPETAERGIAAGDLDMVALGRPLLADPDWPRKAIEGSAASIRPCTSCNWCFDRVTHHQTIGCAENPFTGNELGALPLSGGRGRTAAVIGGGPGGMAAALDFAEAGFDTHLYEARTMLGGGLIASATPPHKDKLFWYLDHLKARLATSAVHVNTGTMVDARAIAALNPDFTILATGAEKADFIIEGASTMPVVSAYDLLMGEVELPPASEGPIMVYGGGETGCETAEHLSRQGYFVILVTRSPVKELARAAEALYRKQLRERLLSNPKLTIHDNSIVKALRNGHAVLTGVAGEDHVKVSCLVLAQGRRTGTGLTAMLTAAGIPFALVGDVDVIGRIGDAVHAARRAVVELTSKAQSPI